MSPSMSRHRSTSDGIDRRGLNWIAPPMQRGDDRDGWGWLHQRRHATANRSTRHTEPAGRPRSWRARADRRTRWAMRGWGAAAIVLAVVSVGLVAAGVARVIAANQPAPAVAPPPLPVQTHSTTTTSTPQTTNGSATSPTGAGSPACTGLTGTTVTDGPGDRESAAGVVAAFEHAYYQLRDVDAAMAVLTPQTRIDPAALGAGIASIPPGTHHCVAITPIAPQALDVHVAEIRPDGTRSDYLQLINVTVAPGATVITAIATRR